MTVQRRFKALPPDPTYVKTITLPTGRKRRPTEVEVTAGDRVRVLAREGRRDGFDARLVQTKIDPATGARRWVDVVPWTSRDVARPVTAEEELEWKHHRKPPPAAVRSIDPSRVLAYVKASS